MKLKNLFLLGALATIFTANAKDVRLYADPYDNEVKNGKANIELWYSTDIETLNAFDVRVYMPEGFTIEKNSRGNFVITKNPNEDAVYDHTFTVGDHTDETDDPYYTIVGLSAANNYLGKGEYMLFRSMSLSPKTSQPRIIPLV